MAKHSGVDILSTLRWHTRRHLEFYDVRHDQRLDLSEGKVLLPLEAKA